MQSIGYVFFFSIVFIPHSLFVLNFFLPDLNAEVILFVIDPRLDFNFFVMIPYLSNWFILKRKLRDLQIFARANTNTYVSRLKTSHLIILSNFLPVFQSFVIPKFPVIKFHTCTLSRHFVSF